MKKIYILSLMVVCFILTSSLVNAQTTITDTINFGGLKRTYRLYVPKIYKASQPVPLILNLHGLTSNSQQQEVYGDFRPIADTANFILVHPEGTNNGLGNGWNNFGALGTGTDDIGFLNALINKISANYSIDQKRIYSTGMSNGGFMSYDLACFLNHRIAAIASVTGSMITSHLKACKVTRPTPVMEIHGTADNTVPYNGGGALSFTHIDTLVNFWVKLNGCGAPVKTTLPNTNTSDGSTVEHYVFDHGKNNTSVELYKVIGGGHSWPGAPPVIAGTNQDFNASKEIWRFFSKYRLDTPTQIVEEQQTTTEIMVFPNPSVNGFYIFLPQVLEGSYAIDIFNGLGQEVLAKSGVTTTCFIPGEALSAGMYFIKIKKGSSVISKKVIVN